MISTDEIVEQQRTICTTLQDPDPHLPLTLQFCSTPEGMRTAMNCHETESADQMRQRTDRYRWFLFLALCSSCAVTLPNKGAAQEPQPAPAREPFVEALKQQWERVESLKVGYQLKTEALDQPEILRRYLGMAYLPEEKVVFAFKGNKRYYRVVYDRDFPPLAPETEPDFDVIPGGKVLRQREQENAALLKQLKKKQTRESLDSQALIRPPNLEVAFDGNTLNRKSPVKVASIERSTTLEEDARWLQQYYMMHIFHTLPDSVNPANDRRSGRLSEVPLDDKFSVQRNLEEADGSSCVVLTGPQKVWLDPKLGFALRKRETVLIEPKVLSERTILRDFVELLPGFWLPKTIWWERCGPPQAPAQYRGKPLVRYVYSVNSLSVNDVPDSLFRLEFEPGWTVQDSTLLPPKDGKRQVVEYTMPADRSQLDRTIKAALAGVKIQESPTWWRHTFLWIGIGLVVVLVGLLVVFWLRKRVVQA
jgi:hypothetical protein